MRNDVVDKIAYINNSLLAMKTRQQSQPDVNKLYKYTSSTTISVNMTRIEFGRRKYFNGAAMAKAEFESSSDVEPLCLWRGRCRPEDGGIWSGTSGFLYPPGAGGGRTLLAYLTIEINAEALDTFGVVFDVEVLTTQPGRIKITIL